jgi:hypothetical protein
MNCLDGEGAEPNRFRMGARLAEVAGFFVAAGA